MGAHTFVSVRVHYVFGTASREHTIKPDLQPRLWAYIAGIARNVGATVYAVGGMDDHAHVFIGVPPTVSVAKAVQAIKANSSRWMRETAPGFAWQEGYAAFSVSISHTDETIAYIQNQAEHHKRRGYGEELAAMLRKHHMNAVS
ncbi:MAG: IS200/IS605 family transposase [Acidobacteriia bacterium]|nr:IS200/IS605 family transposase [Terriglobia bacterium]